jgi:hypothetical protein
VKKSYVLSGLFITLFLLSVATIGAATIAVPDDFGTIQAGIDAATPGDTVLVAPGTYEEAIDFGGKDICVKSVEGPQETTITGPDNVNLVVFHNGETNNAILEGFTILGGMMGIWCRDASPTIRRNILDGQHITNYAALAVGGVVFGSVGYSTAVIENNTIVHSANGAIAAWSHNVITIRNNVIAFNSHYAIHRSPDAAQPVFQYNLSYGNTDPFENVVPGEGCLTYRDPLLNGDYSLQPNSPCINAGDPDPVYNDSDGSRNDMGAIPCLGCPGLVSDTLYVPEDYATIQEAIDSAKWDATILVAPGTYVENLDFLGKRLILKSVDGRLSTTIQAADQSKPVVNMRNQEPKGTVLSGFTITGSHNSGIQVFQGSPAILDNVIRHNESNSDNNGAGVDLESTVGAVIRGNIFRDNTAETYGSAIQSWNASGDTIAYNLIYDCQGYMEIRCVNVNAVIYNNTIDASWSHGISNQISGTIVVFNNLIMNSPRYAVYAADGGFAQVYYNDAWNCSDGTVGGSGTYGTSGDNIDLNPQLNSDYTLRPYSPCIDAGNPSPVFNDPDGSRNDIGAYPFTGTIGADSLIIPSIAATYGENTVTVACKLTQPIRGATIPIAIPPEIEVLGVATTGLLTDSWDYNVIQIKPDSGFIFVALANSAGDVIPAGYTDVFTITFKGDSPVCDRQLAIHLDTTLSGNVSRQLTFVDTAYNPLHTWFNADRDSIIVPELITGDITNDGLIDISDLIAMVAYMFGGGPPPEHMNSMDINGDCQGPDIADLVKLVNYMFVDQTDLPCGCIESGKRAATVSDAGVQIETEYIDGNTIISVTTEERLKGVELSLRNSSGATLKRLYSSGLDFLSNTAEEVTRVGIVDLNGVNTINSGTTHLLTVEGESEIVSAVAADMSARSIVPLINSKSSSLPTKFSLSQNYPNPFNPTTQISFALPAASEITLTVYNIRGQRVSTLAHGWFEAGDHIVSWDGANYASGLYFYRLESGKFVQTRKMILLK